MLLEKKWVLFIITSLYMRFIVLSVTLKPKIMYVSHCAAKVWLLCCFHTFSSM